MLHRIWRLVERALPIALWALALSSSTPRPPEIAERVRAFTRPVEFDHLTWTLDATWLKLQQNAIATPYYIRREKRLQIVDEYLRLTERILQAENDLNRIYADPTISNPETASAELRAWLDALYRRQAAIAPLAEGVIQDQISTVLAELGLTTGGQPIPPVLYHISPLPLALVISPRDTIRQDASISLLPDLSVDQQNALEERIERAMNVSALVVPIGGLGAYPTMVMRTTSLPWLLETVAHEWIHNYLTLHPLGMNYETSPELRTMNETTASIAGKEIGEATLQRFYPHLSASASPDGQMVSFPYGKPDPHDIHLPPFDFRAEMHKTRVTVDRLLAEGKIEEAEAYMEERRRVFWANGYPIRKLNQAYFAFYGAYADVPGGAAGEDPVGPAVRALRAQSASLADFIHRIAWMTSFEDLQRALVSSP